MASHACRPYQVREEPSARLVENAALLYTVASRTGHPAAIAAGCVLHFGLKFPFAHEGFNPAPLPVPPSALLVGASALACADAAAAMAAAASAAAASSAASGGGCCQDHLFSAAVYWLQVEFESKGLKPVFHFTGSRVVHFTGSRVSLYRLQGLKPGGFQAMGQLDSTCSYSPAADFFNTCSVHVMLSFTFSPICTTRIDAAV